MGRAPLENNDLCSHYLLASSRAIAEALLILWRSLIMEIKNMNELEKLRSEAGQSLERLQTFDVALLQQTERLGQNNFAKILDPASKLVALSNKLPLATLDELHVAELNIVKSFSNSVFQQFSEALDFDVDHGDVRNRQNAIVSKIESSYQQKFTQLYPLISYSAALSVDFNRLEEQGRATVQGIKDQTEVVMKDLEEQQKEVTSILADVRKTAAEQGVSQQALYFKTEADLHKSESNTWRIRTIWMSVAVGLYGCSTLFLHKAPFLSPENTYETVQFTVGKVLVFFVLTFMLSLCSKNFLSNRHNEIVNRHRQNALMTYKALVDASGSEEARDVILSHAAASVYRLHDTGYTKSHDGGGSSSSSIVEMLPRTSFPLNAAQGA
jgi:hypothetical protein